MDILGLTEDRIRDLGYDLQGVSAPLANYVPTVTVESLGLVYTAGNLPWRDDKSLVTGKLGDEVSVKEGYESARLAGLSILSGLKAEIGELDRIKRVVKLLGFVNASSNFLNHPKVINGCSDLLVEILQDRGRHARSAVGVSSLPLNASVEIEMIVEIE